jgi:hypothetical protein
MLGLRCPASLSSPRPPLVASSLWRSRSSPRFVHFSWSSFPVNWYIQSISLYPAIKSVTFVSASLCFFAQLQTRTLSTHPSPRFIPPQRLTMLSSEFYTFPPFPPAMTLFTHTPSLSFFLKAKHGPYASNTKYKIKNNAMTFFSSLAAHTLTLTSISMTDVPLFFLRRALTAQRN